jgi:hypothetical protein
MPIASNAFLPRLACQARWVSHRVLLTCRKSQLATQTDARFVSMLQSTRADPVRNARDGRLKGLRCLLDLHGERPLRELTVTEVAEQFARPCERDQLILMQIDGQGSQVRPILRWGLHPYGKAPRTDLLTPRATHLLHLMLSPQQQSKGR